MVKVLEKGTTYLLHNTRSDVEEGQVIKFSHKVDGEIVNGTKNEELAKVLIHRLIYLNNKVRCKENTEAIILFQKGLEVLNNRKQRKLIANSK